MKTFNIQLTMEQWQIIGTALGDQPFKISAPIIAELNRQIQEQNKPELVGTADAAE
jgi:hypothetical protein